MFSHALGWSPAKFQAVFFCQMPILKQDLFLVDMRYAAVLQTGGFGVYAFLTDRVLVGEPVGAWAAQQTAEQSATRSH